VISAPLPEWAAYVILVVVGAAAVGLAYIGRRFRAR